MRTYMRICGQARVRTRVRACKGVHVCVSLRERLNVRVRVGARACVS